MNSIETSKNVEHRCRLHDSGALDDSCKNQCQDCKNRAMEVTIQSTSKIIEFNGVPARVWEGRTKSGIKVHLYVTRIAVSQDEPRIEEFEKELLEVRPPSAEVAAIPLRLIL